MPRGLYFTEWPNESGSYCLKTTKSKTFRTLAHKQADYTQNHVSRGRFIFNLQYPKYEIVTKETPETYRQESACVSARQVSALADTAATVYCLLVAGALLDHVPVRWFAVTLCKDSETRFSNF